MSKLLFKLKFWSKTKFRRNKIRSIYWLFMKIFSTCMTVSKNRDNPSKFSTNELKGQFKRFIIILSNATYENLEDIPKNETFGIDSNDWLDLLYNLSSKFNPEISSGTSAKLYMVDTVTELGFCHSINSKIAGYNSYK